MDKHLILKLIVVALCTLVSIVPAFSQDCNVQILPGTPDTTLCSGDTLQLTAVAEPGGMLIWSTGSMDSVINVSTDGTYIVTLNTDTCSISDTVHVTFSPIPEILDLSSSTSCEGDSTFFTAVLQADTSAIITWDFGDGDEAEQHGLTAEISHFYDEAGTYDVTLTAMNSAGCRSVDSVSAVVLGVPEVALNVEDNCFQDTTFFSYAINCPTGSDCTTILFPGDGSNIALNLDTAQYRFVYGTPDTFQVELYVESAGGCFNAEILEQIVFPIPDADFFGLLPEYCQGDPATELIPVEPGGVFEGPYLETVNDTSIFFSPTEEDSDLSISYTVTNAFSCSSRVEQTVDNVYFTPSVSLQGDDACFMEESVFEIGSDCAEGECTLYLNLGDGGEVEFIGPEGDFNYEYTYTGNPDSFNVSLEVITSNFCTSTATMQHQVFPVPSAVFTGLEDSYCQNDPPVELMPEQTGGVFTGPNISYSADSSQIFFSPQDFGEDIIIAYQIENEFGCSDESTHLIENVFFTPVANIVANATCFQDTSSFVVATICDLVPCEWSIDFGDGTIIDNLSSDISNFRHYYDAVGSYPFVFIAETTEGCADTLSFNQEVNPLPNPSFNDVSSAYCSNDPPFPLIPEQTGGTFTGPGVEMQGDGTGVFTPDIPGENLTISYEITNEFQCTQSSSQSIDNVFAAPEVTLQGLDMQYCEGDLVDTILNLPAGGAYLGNNPYLIDEVESDSIAIFIPNTIGVSTVTYRYEDGNSCSDTFSLEVRVDSLPVANLGPDTSILSGQSITLQNAVDNANYTYEWSGGGSGAEKEIDGPGFYLLTVIDDASGCSSSDTIYVDFANSTSDLALALQEVHVWPNPVADFLNLDFKFNSLPKQELNLIIVDLLGRVIHRQRFLPGSSRMKGIHTGHWPAGVYTLQLNRTSIGKVIKR
ncbi:MAG: PKD domain-containing protein [Phaeodactylibacter xiamenensis]|uniref:PKD domain-containing protein n=1 Tax=Phaeodactylibacter xiamenensis TaxID=1524460 RepID=A0A098S146_9BACT|nr:PKD domain-containing protein [Phaeodactylibacter xiamenensis]KGE85815.1 hypothetical protein IX84_24585 [Phaeodactylibacter xiamenensis]MCR9051189.1 PKD domain-containing protein [bacterium]